MTVRSTSCFVVLVLIVMDERMTGWGGGKLERSFRKHAPQVKLIWTTTTPVRQAANLDVNAENTKRVQARKKIAEDSRATRDIGGGFDDDAIEWRATLAMQRAPPAAADIS